MNKGKKTITGVLLLVLILSLILPGASVLADTQPTITLSSPTSAYSVVTTSEILISGYVTNASYLRIIRTSPNSSSSSASVSVGSNGFFSYTVRNLTEGTNTVTVSATSPGGVAKSTSLTVVYSPGTPPILTISSPADNSNLTGTVDVVGTVQNYDTLQIIINNDEANAITPNVIGNDFSAAVNGQLDPGQNTIVIKASNNEITVNKTLHITYLASSVISDLTVAYDLGSSLVNDFVTVTDDNSSTVSLTGNITDLGVDVEVTCNSGTDYMTAPVASFNSTLNLNQGANAVVIKAISAAGNVIETKQITIYYGQSGPQIYNTAPDSDQTVYSSTYHVTGIVRNTSAVTVKVNGSQVSQITTGNSFTNPVNFSANVNLREGANTIELIAKDNRTPAEQVQDGVTSPEYDLAYTVTYDTSAAITDISATNTTQDPLVPGVLIANVNNVTITGRAINCSNLTINGESVSIERSTWSFTKKLTLKSGANPIIMKAKSISTGAIVTNDPLTINFAGGPVIYRVLPADPNVTTESVTITGTVYNTPANGLKMSLNGGDQVVIPFTSGTGNNPGYFSKGIKLQAGANTIVLTASDGIATATKTMTLQYDARPVIAVTSPVASKTTDLITSVSDSVTITGRVLNAEEKGFYIDHELVSFNKTDGTFSKTVTLHNLVNNIILEARNGSLSTGKTLVIYSRSTPVITITSHVYGQKVDSEVILEGKVFPVNQGEITSFEVGGTENRLNIVDGKFRTEPVALEPGDNFIDLKLTTTQQDDAGAPLTVFVPSKTVTRRIMLTCTGGPWIDINSPAEGSTVYSNRVNINGKLRNAAYDTIIIGDKTVKVGSNGSFEQEVTLQTGKNEIKLTAGAGDTGTNKTLTIYYDPLAKDGAVVKTKAGEGTEIKAFEDDIKIKLEKGSAGANTMSVLSVKDPADLDDPPKQSAFVGPVFHLTWEGNKPIKPYRVTLKYDTAVPVNQAHKVSVLFYDDDKDKWEILGGLVNPSARTVSVLTDKTGYFGAAVYFMTFDDIQNHWGRRDIEFLIARGAVSGNSGQFMPDANVTRAEFVTFLVKALGLTLYDPDRESYSDVDKGSWSYRYIETALRAGLVSGVSRSSFAPNRYISRQEAASILARAGDLKTVKDQELTKVFSGINDAGRISLWAKKDVAAAIKAKILSGSDGNRFLPLNSTTRAQAAAMISRLTDVVNKNKTK